MLQSEILDLVLLIVMKSGFAAGPPKLELQTEDHIWFQVSAMANENNRFMLHCQATDDPESFEWLKDEQPLHIDGERIMWDKPSESGSIIINNPTVDDQGYYQCLVSNLYGTAVTNKIHVELGVLEHFTSHGLRRIVAREGDSLSIPCDVPFGKPTPTVFWVYRDAKQSSVIETIRREHITVDTQGTLHFSAVEKYDGRPNLIYQCAATSPVLHGEYRAGDEVQLIVNPSPADRSVVPIHKLWFSPENVTVKSGSRLKLLCIFGGRPTPAVTWSKIGGELPEERMKNLSSPTSNFGKALIIDNVLPEDEGTYECRSKHLFHAINVSVQAAPFWIYQPEDLNLPEKMNAELRCITDGHPAPIVQWSINGVPLHEVADSKRRLLLDGGRILRIRNLDHDVDMGVYQCNASNSLGYVFANAVLNVRAYAPRFNMPDKRIWKAIRKSTVEMPCEVDAAPEAIVRWVDSNDHSVNVIPGKIQLFPNHTLRISQVSSADEGLYYCNVSNTYGINRAYNRLEVYNPTYFVRVPTPKRLVTEAHASFELFCEAVPDPRLTIDYRWTRNGAPINNDEHFSITNTSLRIRNARGWHSGAIDCAAITDVDVKLSGIDLIVRDIPAKPKINLIRCNNKLAVIRWDSPVEHGDPITKFTIEMQTDFKKGVWRRVVDETKTGLDHYQADITLSPWVNYTFRIIAHNSHGQSDPGYLDGAECRTEASFPYTNPANVYAEGTEPDNLVINWKPMDKYDWNAPNLQYLIRYRLDEPNSEWKEFRIIDPLANHTVIRDQPTFREYLVQVQAVNSVGKSILKPFTHKGFSGEDVPLKAPENFRVLEYFNWTAIAVGWDHVDRSTVRGHFRGYLLEYFENSRPYIIEKTTVSSNYNRFVLHNLKPMTNYTANIYTANKAYRSRSFASMSFWTPEGTPSKVHNLRTYAIGAVSLLLMWERPKEVNGQLRGYFITFENSVTGAIEETYVLNRQLHYLHEGAEPDTGYKVSVWAETNGGEGPKVVRPVRTWPLKDPDPPKFEARAETSSIRIRWMPSDGTHWVMPGASFSVNYSKLDSGDWMQSEIIKLPNTRIVLNDLSEDTDYGIVGIARDGQRLSYSYMVIVHTRSHSTVSHLSHESLHSAIWFIAVLFALLVALLAAFFVCCCQQRQSGKYAVKRKELERGHPDNGDQHQTFVEYEYSVK